VLLKIPKPQCARPMKRPQSLKEERLNAFTHGIGILFCLIAMPIILVGVYDENKLSYFYSVLAFGVGMLLAYTFSTLYHAVKKEKAKDVLQIADHISIYFLIAGTYTPLMVRYLESETAFIFLTIMWSIVAVGVVFKIFFTKRFKYLSVILYLLLGWMIVFVLKPLLQNIPSTVLWWIIAGGFSYTTGVYFYMKDHKIYYHAVWHLFVLFGTLAHFISVWISF
jgi:hemolysin III